jgi:hypothetical protein
MLYSVTLPCRHAGTFANVAWESSPTFGKITYRVKVALFG